MPIQKLLATSDFTPEQRRVCEMAFNNTMLSLVDRNDPLCEMIARKIIEIGATGVTNSVAITEMPIRQFSQPPH